MLRHHYTTTMRRLIVFVLILDRQMGPGLSLILGVGVGGSGVLIVDIMKRKVQGIIEGINK